MISALRTHKFTTLSLALLGLACIAGFAPPADEVVGSVSSGCQMVMQQDRGDLGQWQGSRATKEAVSGSSVCGSEARKMGDRYSEGGAPDDARQRIERIMARR